MAFLDRVLRVGRGIPLGSVPGALGWVPPRVQVPGIRDLVAAPAPDPNTFRVVPVPQGPDGILATLQLMGQLIDEGAGDPYWINEARAVVRECAGKDYLCEAQAILSYVKDVVTYREASLALLQYLQGVGWTMNVDGAGCCADMSVVIGVFDKADGKRVALRAVAVDSSMPDSYSHVYSRIFVNGEWLAQDAVGPGQLGWEPPESAFTMPPLDLEV